MLLALIHIMIDLSFLYLTKQIFVLYLQDEKCFYIITTFFYNNLGIHAVIIYFCFVLVGLINGYKNHEKYLFS